MFEIFSQLFVNKYTVAVLLILIGFVIAKFVFKIVLKLLLWLEIDELCRKFGINIPLSNYISHLLEFIIYLYFILRALNEIGLTQLFLSILGIIIIITVLLSLILTIKDFFPNIYASYNINKRLKYGSSIKCNGVEGVVRSIGTIETIVKSKNGDLVYIPNSYLVNNLVVVKK